MGSAVLVGVDLLAHRFSELPALGFGAKDSGIDEYCCRPRYYRLSFPRCMPQTLGLHVVGILAQKPVDARANRRREVGNGCSPFTICLSDSVCQCFDAPEGGIDICLSFGSAFVTCKCCEILCIDTDITHHCDHIAK